MHYSERNGSSTNVLHKKDHNEAPMRTIILTPTSRNRKVPYLHPEERKFRITSMLNELKTLILTPLIPTKKVEFYSKWGPLLAKEAACAACPQISDEIIELVKEKSKRKVYSRRRIRRW